MLNVNMSIAIKGDLGSFKCSHAYYLCISIRAQEYFGIIQESQPGALKHLIFLGALYLPYLST